MHTTPQHITPCHNTPSLNTPCYNTPNDRHHSTRQTNTTTQTPNPPEQIEQHSPWSGESLQPSRHGWLIQLYWYFPSFCGWEKERSVGLVFVGAQEAGLDAVEGIGWRWKERGRFCCSCYGKEWGGWVKTEVWYLLFELWWKGMKCTRRYTDYIDGNFMWHSLLMLCSGRCCTVGLVVDVV